MESQAQEVIIKMGIGSPGSKIASAPIRRIMAMDYLVDVIQNILARADDILDVFKVVRKNSLEDVLFIHKNILQYIVTKSTPQQKKKIMSEGKGS